MVFDLNNLKSKLYDIRLIDLHWPLSLGKIPRNKCSLLYTYMIKYKVV